MLVKLLKHEFKATGRIFLPMFGLLAIFSVITKYVTGLQKFDSLFSGLLVIIPAILYGGIIVGIVVMSIVMLIQRFTKNLLGDEGYLMHTLPATAGSHIISKLIVGSVWIIFSAILVSISALYMAVDIQSWGSLWSTVSNFFNTAASTFQLKASTFFWGASVLSVVYVVEKTLMIYAGLGIGHTSAKQKVGASVAMIIGLHVGEQVFFTLVMVLVSKLTNGITIFDAKTDGEMMRSFFWWYLGSTTVFGTLYAFLSNRMLKHHLNLA